MEEYILKQVTLPAQYINSEWNSETLSILSKSSRTDVIKVCLCFPEKYTIAMSNLGIEILYKMLNSYNDVICERIFAVDKDLENILERNNIPLVSLESKRPLKEFDIIGFSLQSELSFTNIFTILYLSKISFETKDRKNFFPLITAGGPCTSNPTVLSKYIDFFILGEAENVFIEVVNLVKKYKKLIHQSDEYQLKQKFLTEINNIQNVYVPGMKKTVFPATVDLGTSYYPVYPTVPNIRTTHLRLNVEISRGCVYDCNFCQGKYIYNTFRIRSKDKVMEYIEKGINSTGYNEVALTGFCVTNYPYLYDILKFVKEKFKKNFVSISLPSLRVEGITEKLLEYITTPRKSGVTIAPEAATEHLRKIINKYISDEEIYNALVLLSKFGFKKVKLYFMIGLPGETDEDIEKLILMIKKINKIFHTINFNIAISPFIPKPHTPFQFYPMATYGELERKLSYLYKTLKKNFLRKNLYLSVIEALISRGDETIGKLIEQAWCAGARFDAWDESFNSEIWQKCIISLGIDVEKYIYKETDINTKFPWDIVEYKVSKEQLYKKFLSSKIVPNDNKNFLWRKFLPNVSVEKVSPKVEFQPLIKYRIRLKFARFGKTKFLSHLDQIEIFRRTLRMNNLPLVYTSGYNPEIRMSFGPPISVGYESKCEFVDVDLYKNVDIDIIKKNIEKNLLSGYFLYGIKYISKNAPALTTCLNLTEYYITYPENKFDKLQLKNFLLEKEIFIEKQKLSGLVERISISELIKKIEIVEDNKIHLFLRFSPHKTLKPEIVIGKIFNIPEHEFFKFDILRENLYIETVDGKIIEIM